MHETLTRMKSSRSIFIPGCFFLLFTIAIGIGWRMAKGRKLFEPQPVTRVQSKGPVDPAFCGPLGQSLPPPAFDSPFGLDLYASNPARVIHPLPAMQIVNQLGLPHSIAKEQPRASPEGVPVNESAFDDVQSVGTLLEEYRRAFGAMPMGELNDEIVRRLQNENPKGVAVLPKSHPAISTDGELLDRWGTPYRFHPESGWEMTVRSAGPDKKMWTSDDIITDRLDDKELAINH